MIQILFPFIISFLFYAPATPPIDCMSMEEKELYELIIKYRKSKGLPVIALSEKLNKVARLHAKDLAENYEFDPNNKCNPHSWSEMGNWTPCCYTNDHAEAECMWKKPMEIAGYPGSGYEIAFYQSSGAKPGMALKGWQSSQSHNPILLNQGMWKQINWNAIGIGIYEEYAIVWFGQEKDTQELIYCN